MIPDINIFGKTISAYMLFVLAGVFAVLYYTYRTAKSNGLDEVKMLYTALTAFVGVIFGGHILYGVTQIKLITAILSDVSVIRSFSDFVDAAVSVFGGSVFYGGLIGAVAACAIYLRKTEAPIAPFADIGAVAVPMFHFFGRLGCFFSGCCYGIEAPFGVVYRYSQAPGANSVTRFPVQLCEALFNLLLCLLLAQLLKKEKCKGKLLSVYLIAYPVARFLLEFLRGDEYRGRLFGLSTSQIISVILIICSVSCLVKTTVTERKIYCNEDLRP